VIPIYRCSTKQDRYMRERHFAGEEYRSGFAVKVSADGRGVVSHAGMGVLRELADLTGL
jgi:hypothetical protein